MTQLDKGLHQTAARRSVSKGQAAVPSADAVPQCLRSVVGLFMGAFS